MRLVVSKTEIREEISQNRTKEVKTHNQKENIWHIMKSYESRRELHVHKILLQTPFPSLQGAILNRHFLQINQFLQDPKVIFMVGIQFLLKAAFTCWVILHALLSSANFFQNQLFQKILSGIPSECQTVWIQIRPDICRAWSGYKLFANVIGRRH